MNEQLEEYYRLLKQLIRLQQKLLNAFETQVKVVGLDIHKRFAEGQLKDVLIPYHTVTDVLRAWPEGVSVLPLVTWAGPMIGIIQVEGQNWFFHIHGYLEVQFVWLPSTLNETALTALKTGEMSVLKNLPEYGPEIDTAYFGRGRTDGITAHSAHGFARSIGSTFGHLSKDEHKALLEKLAEKGILMRVPEHSPNFVFASSKHLALENIGK